MRAVEIAPGLWRWTAYHPEWRQEVGCLAVESDDGLLLVDPLAPPRELRKPAHVLVTIYWHARSAADLGSVRVWAPRPSAAPLRRRGIDVTDPFRPDAELPGGVRALASGRRAEAVLWLPQQRALVAGDVLLGGPLRMCPDSWVGKGGRAAVREALRPTLRLPLVRILTSHGEPVLGDGRRALEAALEL